MPQDEFIAIGSTGLKQRIQVLADGTAAPVVALPSGAAALSSLPPYTTLQNAVSASGPGATMAVAGLTTCVFDISGSFVAQIAFETLQADGATWVPLSAVPIGSVPALAGASAQIANAPGLYQANVAGLDSVRARVIWTSGTVTVKARGSLLSAFPTPMGKFGMVNQPMQGRGIEVLHRSGIVAPDVLNPPTITTSAITEAGSVLTAALRHVMVTAINKYGSSLASADASVTPTANQAVRLAVPQVVGAARYGIFLGTVAQPLWVGEMTEAQRATGDRIISAVGVLSARAGSTVAGTIDVGIDGTGPAANASPQAAAWAVTPDAVVAGGVVPYDADGINSILVQLRGTFSNFGVVPSGQFQVFKQSVQDPTIWTWVLGISYSPLATVAATPLIRDQSVVVNGARAVLVLLTSMAGNGYSFDVTLTPIL